MAERQNLRQGGDADEGLDQLKGCAESQNLKCSWLNDSTTSTFPEKAFTDRKTGPKKIGDRFQAKPPSVEKCRLDPPLHVKPHLGRPPFRVATCWVLPAEALASSLGTPSLEPEKKQVKSSNRLKILSSPRSVLLAPNITTPPPRVRGGKQGEGWTSASTLEE